MLVFLITIISGITTAGPLFIIASGLTMIYGVMRVLNFAHPALFMVGAYLAVKITGGKLHTVWELIFVALAAAAIVGVLGVITERLVFRPLYRRPSEVTLLASYGLSLLLVGAVERIWGNNLLTMQLPTALQKSVRIFSASISLYSLVELGVSILIGVGLYFLLRRTRFGANALAVAEDREMATVMGIRSRRVGMIVFLIGAMLAGLAGAMIAPTVAIDTSLVDNTLIPVFAVVIMGGLGRVEGAALAALAIGLVESFTTNYAPTIEPYSFILLLLLFLVFRPQGLLGRLQMSHEA
jgi:branched-chain amino acid transport system permease protein